MNLAKQFNHDFENGPFKLFDSNGNRIYYENPIYWAKTKYDSDGLMVSFENSHMNSVVHFKRPTKPISSCDGKVVGIDGKEYQLKEV